MGPRLDGDADPGQLGAGGTEGGVGDIRGIPGGGAGVTAPAVGRGRVVQAALQERHPTLAGPLVVEHELLLGATGGGDSFIAFSVVGPRLPRREPPTADPPDRAVDVEDLEQQLQPSPADVDDGFQGGGRERPPCGSEGLDHRSGALLGGHGDAGEVGPDVAVLRAGHEQHVGPFGGPARATNLLVVGDRRRGRPDVDDEAEIGLVETHPEGRGRDQCLDLVVA